MSKSRSTNLATSNSFPIVCVGASAGGLEALTALLNAVPKNSTMAFVLIQHLEPMHKSALVEILSRETSLAVCEAKNNVKIEPAHAYVISPNTLMAVSRGRLKITTRARRTDGRYLPIDFCMNSLAKDQNKKAIGVILSGTGSDGTLGAKAIKARGGIVFAQDKKTARYFGMPGSVIASGFADFVLDPRGIARKLIHSGPSGITVPLRRAEKVFSAENGLALILALLRDLTGVDFAHYKQATISRRISRRMSFRNIKNFSAYYSYLEKDPAEADVLLKDILIPVTSFFRDPEVFTALRKKVFPSIANKSSSQNPVRIWVPACSTGEEVYSIAISFYEFLEERKIKPHVQIFGTDLSEALIAKARAGLYAEDISAHVSPERLRRFFTKIETGYKITKHIRDLCVFARHDITGDPPLSNMDIASCRNLLIYLDAFLQNKALSMLHYALKPKGYLVLGSAESVTAVPGHFGAVDKKQKIYSKNVLPRKVMLGMGMIKTNTPTTKARSEKMIKKFLQIPISDAPATGARSTKKDMLKALAVDGHSGSSEKNLVKLKEEFARTVAHLHAISEEKDTFNEELKAANEEIQSSNEELQSMNEELETSKEELQSTNEELLTLNEELQNKNVELTHLNGDLSNVFSSTNIPIIIVGGDLRIKRFTPTARKVMNLIPTDVDRPIGDIKLNIDIVNLEETLLGVIEDMVPRESEVTDKDGRWYSVRIRPYRTVDNKIDGAIITLIDIDAIKRSREEVQGALEYAQAIIETMREPLLVLNKHMRVLSVNKAFCDTFKVQLSEVNNKLLYELGEHQWDNPGLRKLLSEVLPQKKHFNDFEVSFHFPGIGQKTMALNGRQIALSGKDSPLILLVIEDITKRKQVEDILRRDNKMLDKIINQRSKELLHLQVEVVKSRHLSAIGTLAATVAHELRNPLADIALSVYRIRKSSTDPLIEEILTGISARISESDQIINNILMYAKSPITHYESVKINDILKGAIELVQKFPVKKISINERMECTEDLIIEVDPVRVREVFRNILQNAIDAVDADTGIIEFETVVNDATVSVLIRDNGGGISKKDLKNIANPFFTTKAKGTGLGLAVCRQVVMLHDGTITIKSVKGKGTTVTVTLPVRKQGNG